MIKQFENLPKSAVEYINLVIKNMRYRKKVREEVREELIDHFEEHLKDCATNEEKEQKAQQLISEFGDAKLLGQTYAPGKKTLPAIMAENPRKSVPACRTDNLRISVHLRFWLRMGKPTIKINYAQWLTDQQRQGRDESLNAMPEIDKAAELVIKSTAGKNCLR